MSYIDVHYDTTYDEQAYFAPPSDSPRTKSAWAAFLIPIALSGVSSMSNGVPELTDASFVALTLICATFVAVELTAFPRRLGIGALVIYGGVCVWFSYDYFSNWFGHDFVSSTILFSPGVIAKCAFYHCIFVASASVGLNLPVWRSLSNRLSNIPEPIDSRAYVTLILVCFFIGLSPYFLFTAQPWYEAIYLKMVGGRTGGVAWTVGRTGNVNTSWGGYIVQLFQIGNVGAQLALFYALLFARDLPSKLLCWAIWLFTFLGAIGSGTRGETAFIALPAAAMVYYKYQLEAAALMRRVSVKAYVVAGIWLVIILLVIQVQIAYRNIGFAEADMSRVQVTNLQGNSMFSEGLEGWALVPETRGFFGNQIPGEGMIRAMPETLWRFLIGPIPRALWLTKPIDPMGAWYSAIITGRAEDDYEGTTISTGLVGDWYFRYGMAGVIEGGMLFGWLARMAEVVLKNSRGKMISLLLALGFEVWLFRCFRNFSYLELYPLLIGITFLFMYSYVSRRLSGQPS